PYARGPQISQSRVGLPVPCYSPTRSLRCLGSSSYSRCRFQSASQAACRLTQPLQKQPTVVSGSPQIRHVSKREVRPAPLGCHPLSPPVWIPGGSLGT